MVSAFFRILFPVAGLLALWGCSKSSAPTFVAKHEPWRAHDERACLASGVVRENRFLRSRSALGGPSVCGAMRPFEMTGAAGGRVLMKPKALVRCPMVPKIDDWVWRAVIPASRYHFGSPVVEMKVAASYACRPINHRPGAKLSEHGHANAIDISAFVLADGRTVTIKNGWRGSHRESAFLHDVHRAACDNFSTVLGPNFDANHHDHFHLDLARRGRSGKKHFCK